METITTLKCTNCRKKFNIVLWQVTAQKKKGQESFFCSRSCSSTYNQTGVVRRIPKFSNCQACRKRIEIKKGSSGKYCDNICQRTDDWAIRKAKIKKTGKTTSHRQAKRYLLEKFGARCRVCKRTNWLGKPILLILDHINGKAHDVRISNLRLICSNCDAQTSTYKNRNMGNGRHSRRLRYAAGKSY